MRISRRKFLQLLGVSGALAGGASTIWAVPDKWRETLRSGPRIESWSVSTCGQCPAGCGIRVRRIDGIPVRILGNPLSPVNHGFVCPMGEAGLELLFHPDRVTRPLRRTGKKGDLRWEPISWDEALKQISSGLRGPRHGKSSGPFGFLLGDRNTLLTELARDFTARMGSSLFFPWRTPRINELGLWQGTGQLPPFAFDVTRTDYLITFGTNLLEEPHSPVYFNRLYGELKATRGKTGLKMVHVDARMSQAGRNSTEWVQIRPGSMGVLALGMAHVILRDQTHDRKFLDRHTRDFRNGGDDFRSMVDREYSPERVSGITGVPASTILRLAREFGSANAPLALSGGTSDSSETGMFTQWAVAGLNALSGGFSASGLWREPVPVPWGPSPVAPGNSGAAAFSRSSKNLAGSGLPASWIAERLPDLAAAGRIPGLETLLIAQVDPLFQAANRNGWKDWLSGIPRVVQFATMIDDTSAYADLVLPVPTFLEQWDLTLPPPNLPFSQLGLQQPILPPVPETRPLGDILLRLGEAAGADLSPGNRGKPYEEYLQSRMQRIFASGKGTPYFEIVSLAFLEDLRKRGWQVYSYPAFEDFWRLFREKGGWWDPEGYPEVDWNGNRKFVFPTASRLAALLKTPAIPVSEKEAEPPDQDPGRMIEKRIRKPEGAGAFLLVPFPTLMNMTGDGAGQPLLQEMFGLYPRLYWNSWAEMHPERAAPLNLQDGDLIRVTSGSGSMTLPVRIVPTVSREILAVPFGQGHRESGRHAKNIGVNPISILDRRGDPISGRTSWQSTVVRVEKIAT